nr:ORF121 [Lymantria dispar multiple nucleopolyhedrovirus]
MLSESIASLLSQSLIFCSIWACRRRGESALARKFRNGSISRRRRWDERASPPPRCSRERRPRPSDTRCRSRAAARSTC